MSKEQIKGITGFQIKIFALLFMLMDHIHYFFEFTGKVPLAFSWIGRLAGGLFLFCIVEGYTHTSNKKKYFLRIYIISVCMTAVKYLIQSFPSLQRSDGFCPENGIFSTFIILFIMFKGMDYIKNKQRIKGIGLLLLPLAINYAVVLFITAFIPMPLGNHIFMIISTFIPFPFTVEGGLYVILTGVILYTFKNNRKYQCIAYITFVLLWMVGLPLITIKPINLKLMFTSYYEWMSIFAAVFMVLYNGKRGKSMKQLFYIFYPAHIYILYILSFFIK